jgi:O-antigen/teichoic acid export membrane protein
MKRNILANYAGAGVIALAPILALPWYLLALGPKQFGLVGFVVLLQAVLGLLDAGMSQALVREVALHYHAGPAGRHRAADLLFGFERIYWGFALAVGLLLALLSPSISSHWLALDGLAPDAGQVALYGAAAIFAVQFPGSLYRSLLVGAQAHVRLNLVMMAGALLRHLGGALVVTIWPSLATYLLWHVAIASAETLVRALLAWHTLAVKRRASRWNSSQLRSLAKVFAGMSAATLLGALTVQIDKMIVSKLVLIEQFGYYMIATTVSAGALQLIYPLVQAALPGAIALKDDPAALHRLSLKLARLIGAITLCSALAFVMLGDWLLMLWLKDLAVVQVVRPVLSVLLIGSVLNAFYNVGYVHWLVHQRLGRIFQVNVLALVLSVLVIPPLVGGYGIIGAAAGWVAINLIGFSLSLGWYKHVSDA